MEENLWHGHPPQTQTKAMTILRESMTRLRVAEYTFRIWREEPNWPMISGEDLREATVWKFYHESKDILAIAEKIILLDRVNAVEALTDDGNGVVLYRD